MQEVRNSHSKQRRGDMSTDGDVQTHEQGEPGVERPRGLPAEVMLLQTMLADERLLEMTADRLDPAWLSGSVAARVIQDVLRLYGSNEWDGPKSLLNRPQGEETGNLVSELLLDTQPPKRPEAVTVDCLASLERQWLEHQVRDVRKELSKPGVSPAVVATLQKQWLDLDSKLRHIAAFLMGKQ